MRSPCIETRVDPAPCNQRKAHVAEMTQNSQKKRPIFFFSICHLPLSFSNICVELTSPGMKDKVVLSHLELIASECPFRHSSQDDNVQEKQTQIFHWSGQNVQVMNLEHCFHCRAFLSHRLSSVFQQFASFIMKLQLGILSQHLSERSALRFVFCHISHTPQPHVASGYHTGQHRMDELFELQSMSRISYHIVFKNFLLEDNRFTILCWYLPYVNMNQSQVYTCPLPLKPPSHQSLVS